MQETVNEAISIIQEHLEEQDNKIDNVIMLLNKIGGDKVE